MAPQANAAHHHYVPLGDSVYEIDRNLEPILEIESGDTVEIETDDAFTGQIRKSGDLRDKATMPHSNPVRGPIRVAGAVAGDSLQIEIRAIEPLEGQCATYLPDAPHITALLGREVPPPAGRVCKIHSGEIDWSDTLKLPYRPMIGVIATAPALGVPSTVPPGDYGGNLDLIEVAPGSIVTLPVAVPGGLLFLGDCHALMGHGEITGAGLEMRGRVTLRVEVRKDSPVPGPRVETASAIGAVAATPNLEQAVAAAFGRLALWLEDDFDMNRWTAYSLLGQVGELSTGYVLSGAVAAKIGRAYLPTR